MTVSTISDGIARTRIANGRFKVWYEGFTKRFSKPLGIFIKSPTLEQKGVFEGFFATYNYGIFVRDTGYDIFCLNPNELDEQTRNASFLWDMTNFNGHTTDYYWKRNWNEIPEGNWNFNSVLRYEYFTICAIVETMKLINVDKRK